MKNNFFYLFRSKIKLNVKGRHIERFIKKLSDHKINLLDVKVLNRNEVNIVIFKSDYLKVLDLKTIYEFNVLNGYGFVKVKKILKLNYLLITFLFLSIISVYILSKITFSIDVIHNSPKVREFILSELDKYGIRKNTFKKNFNELQQIKNKILDNHKDKLEWLEIESIGTKYIIRLEERKLNNSKLEYQKQHVVATKSAVIKKIEAKNGQIVKEINSYVKPGDVVISGNIMLNDVVKDTIKADGVIYGEVWYKVKVSYPFVYKENHETGKKKNVIVFNFLNKKLEFNLNKYKNKNIESKTLIKHLFLPISINFEKQKEIEVIEEINTIDEAITKAEKKAYDELSSKLNDKEMILSSKNLKVDVNDSKIELEIFFIVYEDITGYTKIEEVVEE